MCSIYRKIEICCSIVFSCSDYTLVAYSSDIQPFLFSQYDFSNPHLDAPSPSASSTIVKIPTPVTFPVFGRSVPGATRMFRSGMDTRTMYGWNAAPVYTAFPDPSKTECP